MGVFFFAARSVEGWWGVSGNTDPINLSQWAQCLLTSSSLVSPPVHLKPAVSHCTTRTHTCVIPICPAGAEAALIHSTWAVTSTSIASSVKTRDQLTFLFLWPILLFISAACDLHRVDKQGEKLKYELTEVVKKKNCAIFTSQALSWQSSREQLTMSEQIESQCFCSRSLLQDAWLLMDTLVVTASTGPLTFRCRVVSLTTSLACNPFHSLLMHVVDAPIQNDLQWASREVQYLSYWQFDKIRCPLDGCMLGMDATFQFLQKLFSWCLKLL